MSEDHLIRHCAPTLAGLKTGSLFSCSFTCQNDLLNTLRKINQRLLPKGVRVLPLRLSDNRALIYVYRPKKLILDIANTMAEQILLQNGYDTAACDKCIVRLAQRIRSQDEFPHEIGLFLGYPPEDVCGFIENKACNCKCVGCWKVYGDESAAKRKFAQYKKCTEVYRNRWATGVDIERLTVAG